MAGLVPTIVALVATVGFYLLIKFLWQKDQLEVGLPIGLALLAVSRYALLPLADRPEYFVWVTIVVMPCVVFGALLGTLGIGALAVKFLRNWSAKLNKKHPQS
ncbi:MAG: hypothetical protein HYT41_01925 [Candidatus Sungbacteria bacterium]|nr:hypothetical protein [Candidatus Sungbacteria bacterium]